MHGEVDICMGAAARRLKWFECTLILLMVRLILWLWLGLQTLLQLSNGGAIKGCRWKNARLEDATVETGAIAVETLAKNLTTTNND
jgi:hypothetical protein